MAVKPYFDFMAIQPYTNRKIFFYGDDMKSVINSPKALGQCIQRVRKNKNLTQQAAGSHFKIDQTTISSIEQGAAGTRIETLFRLLAALDLELVIQDKNADHQKVEW